MQVYDKAKAKGTRLNRQATEEGHSQIQCHSLPTYQAGRCPLGTFGL